MKKIFARFNSKCAETGKQIKKGEEMYYDYSAKKCYCLTSSAAQAIMNPDPDEKAAKEERDVANYIQAQEDAYWDNQTGGDYSR